MFARSVVAVALLSGMAVAQNNSTYIDPSTVDLSTRASWCNGQSSACSTLCSSATANNTCDDVSLTYNCTCSDGDVPDLAAYLDTLPTYICTESFDQCMDDTPSTEPDEQKACTTDILDVCGTSSLADFTPSASSSSASVTATTTTSEAATSTAAAASATSSTSSGGAIAVSAGSAEFGLVVLATTLFGAFSALL